MSDLDTLTTDELRPVLENVSIDAATVDLGRCTG